MFQEEIKPWNKLLSESDVAYRAFCLYLNMGKKRSMTTLMTTIGKGLSIEQLNSWSNTFLWNKRVELCEGFLQGELLNNSASISDDAITLHKIELPASTSHVSKQLQAKYFRVKGQAKQALTNFSNDERHSEIVSTPKYRRITKKGYRL